MDIFLFLNLFFKVGAECIYFGDEQLPEGVHEYLRNAYRGSQ